AADARPAAPLRTPCPHSGLVDRKGASGRKASRLERHHEEALADDAIQGDWQTALIGVGKAFASPPSEPHVRFSRIRLSSRWFPHRGCLAHCQAVCRANSPAFAK